MKKILIFGAVLGVVVLALGVAGYVYAQSQTPTPANPGNGYGYGMMGGNGRGMMGGGYGMMGNWGNGNYGPMHDYMIPALAEKLGLTAEELQARIDGGETPYQVAQSLGFSEAEISDLFLAAHDAALDAAVAAGVITQAQADWMDQHMELMWQNGGPGFGGCHGGYGQNGAQGRGPGGRWNRQP